MGRSLCVCADDLLIWRIVQAGGGGGGGGVGGGQAGSGGGVGGGGGSVGGLGKERDRVKAAWQLATGLLTSTHPAGK